MKRETGNFVYLLACADGSYYGGWTNDLVKRLRAHNLGQGARYTRSRRPVSLCYFERYLDKQAALSREWHIKRLSHGQKRALTEANQAGLMAAAFPDGVGETTFIACPPEPALTESIHHLVKEGVEPDQGGLPEGWSILLCGQEVQPQHCNRRIELFAENHAGEYLGILGGYSPDVLRPVCLLTAAGGAYCAPNLGMFFEDAETWLTRCMSLPGLEGWRMQGTGTSYEKAVPDAGQQLEEENRTGE